MLRCALIGRVKLRRRGPVALRGSTHAASRIDHVDAGAARRDVRAGARAPRGGRAGPVGSDDRRARPARRDDRRGPAACYHLYGTRYACGFQWGAPSPWCGFGVSRARSLAGPWTAPGAALRTVRHAARTRSGRWQQICGDTGLGCFNPRMIQRSGWGDERRRVDPLVQRAGRTSTRDRANAYYAMTCAGPDRPVRRHRRRHRSKPSMHQCTGNGDFSIVRDDPRPPVMLCTMADQTLVLGTAHRRPAPSGAGDRSAAPRRPRPHRGAGRVPRPHHRSPGS